jgi:hypothetical protein
MSTMFANNPLARRLGRLRRSNEPVALDRFPDLDDMLETLYRWGASLPWVAESPCRDRESLMRRFVVDCPLLDCSGLWFAVDAGSEDLEEGPEVLVVLPKSIAHRGIAHGWAAKLVELAGDRMIVEVALPTTNSELCALQTLLQVAYSAAFVDTAAE